MGVKCTVLVGDKWAICTKSWESQILLGKHDILEVFNIV